MKKILSILVSVMFAVSLTGLAFAEEAAPAADQPKVEEQAPAKAEKKEVAKEKTKKHKKEHKKAEKKEKAEETKEGEPAPAENK
ncbi:MAG: hypothetical protein NTZ51_11620 [Proteobacteria bacterium]|nr:hypothetical protein [Pseudomonadota bacterium]